MDEVIEVKQSMKLILYSFYVFLVLVGASCQQKKSSTEAIQLQKGGTSKGVGGAPTATVNPGKAPEKPFSALGKAPKISSQDLQPGLGKTPANSQVPAEFANKPYLGMLTATHRPIWLDLSKQVWPGFNAISDKFVAGYEGAIQDKRVSEYIRKSFARPEVPTPLNVTIQQPLPAPWLPSFASDVTVLFSVVGFSAWRGDAEEGTSLVVAESPFMAASKEALLMEPKDYEEVYSKQGPLLMDFIKKCLDLEMNSTVINYAQDAECDGIRAAVDLTSYNETTKLANNAFSDLFQKRSVKIWRPRCSEGYAALGYIATNGRMDKPYAESDFSQGPFSSAYSKSSKKATYCLPQKLLVPGKIGEVVFKESSPQGLEIYAIAAADERGLAPQGLFVAKAGKAALPTKLWVLAKQYVELVK